MPQAASVRGRRRSTQRPRPAAAPRRATTAAAATGKARSEAGEGFLGEDELEAVEREHPEGLTLAQIIDLFTSRGLHLSEATFRKYVQLGLLGRSRRVGRKGKHQGSLGLYPATTVRRVNAIKRMMAQHYTIEDIQRSFLRFTEEIEALRRDCGRLCDGFEREVGRGQFTAEQRRQLSREVQAVRKLAGELVQRVETLERQVVSPLERAARERAFSTGGKGGAEELL